MYKSPNPLEIQNRNKLQKQQQQQTTALTLCGAFVSLCGFGSLCGGFEVIVHLFFALSSSDPFFFFLHLNAYMPIAHILHLTDEYVSVIFGLFIMCCLSGNLSAQLMCVTPHKFSSREMVPHALRHQRGSGTSDTHSKLHSLYSCLLAV